MSATNGTIPAAEGRFGRKMDAEALRERAGQATARADLDTARARSAVARAEIQAANARSRALKSASDGFRRLLGSSRASAMHAGNPATALNLGYESARPRHRLRADQAAPPGGSAQAALDKPTRDVMRKEVQHLLRNNSLARAMVARYEDFVVGDGPIVSPTSNDESFNDEAQRCIEDFFYSRRPETLGRPNIRGGAMHAFVDDLRAVLRQVRCTDGDMLAVKTFDDRGLGTIQYIEGERLVNPKHAPGGHYADSEFYAGGVEISRGGGHRNYHVADWNQTQSYVQMGTSAIPAGSAWFLANPVGYVHGQVRGEPVLQATTKLFEVLDGYIDDAAMSAQVQTWIGVIFKSERPADFEYAVEAGNADIQATGRQANEPKQMRMGPGWYHTCKPNESAVAFDPTQPVSEFRDFVLTLTQIVGADIAVPVLVVLFLSDGLSFSNLRGLLSIAGRIYSYVQDWLCRYVRSVYIWKLDEWIRLGVIKSRPDDWDSVEIMLPPPPVVDFKMESEGYAAAAKENLIPKTTAVQLLGFGRFKDVVRKRGLEKKMEIAAGVSPPELPGAKPAGGGGQTREQAQNNTEDRSPEDDGDIGAAAEPEADPRSESPGSESEGAS